MTATKREVDGFARELFGPLFAEPSAGQSWRVVGWDAEQGLCLTVEQGDATLLVELEPPDAARECYTRTSRFNVCVRRMFEPDAELSHDNRALVDHIVRVVNERQARLPALERPSTSQRVELREILVERVLIPEGRGQYYINPYVGCTIGCDFCYVIDRADFSRALEGLPHQPWGRYVHVKANAAEILAEEVRVHAPGPVRFSPILTDPYQGVEGRYRITRKCLDVLLGAGFSPIVLTRARRVVDDIDLFRQFAQVAVGLSIPTDDDACRRIFEPGADPIDDRVEALDMLERAGVRTFAVIQPMLPMNVARLVDRVAPLVKVVRIDRMYFLDRVRDRYLHNHMAHALTDSFFERTQQELVAAFSERGVIVDDMDDLSLLLG